MSYGPEGAPAAPQRLRSPLSYPTPGPLPVASRGALPERDDVVYGAEPAPVYRAEHAVAESPAVRNPTRVAARSPDAALTTTGPAGARPKDAELDAADHSRVIGRGPDRPLRVVHVGTQLVQAGIDRWLTTLIRSADADRMQFLRCLVTSDVVNYAMAADLPVPVVVGGREAVRQAVDDCDILLMAGPPALGEWLADKPPRLGVFVAHGVCNWTRTFMDGCLPVVDHVIAVSPLVQQLLCDDVPSTVIPNGVDPRHLVQMSPRERVRAACGFSGGDFVLGFVGRLSREKRPEALIEAVARLPRRFKLLIVGWGALRSELLELANRLIPGRYAFRDADEPVGDCYAAMDACCLVSEYEGFGLVGLEAMHCGKPLIATDVGFAHEAVVDRVNGVLVDGTPRGIAQAAQWLADHPDWARGLAAEGRRHAEAHGDAGLMADRYATLLERLWRDKERQRRREAAAATTRNGSLQMAPVS